MKTIMSLEQLTTIEAVRQFLGGTQSVVFKLGFTDTQTHNPFG